MQVNELHITDCTEGENLISLGRTMTVRLSDLIIIASVVAAKLSDSKTTHFCRCFGRGEA